MVKANAYGHGSKEVSAYLAKHFEKKESLSGFGVATLEEGIQVRRSLETIRSKLPILIFSGTTPWRKEAFDLCFRFKLTPTLTTFDDFILFSKHKDFKKLNYEIKFNTGMNRLGIDLVHAQEVRKILRTHGATYQPSGILSHLAVAEKPTHPLSLLQKKQFIELRRIFAHLGGNTLFHLGNSAAIWDKHPWELEKYSDVARPGLSLYGIAPTDKFTREALKHGLTPAMRVFSPVIARHTLQKGARIGYGGTPYRGEVAILRVGYADGLHRILSNQGKVRLFTKNKELNTPQLQSIIGVISMDLCSTRCSAQTKPGDWAQLLGHPIDLWTQAKLAGTIPYELLTSISQRVRRIYAR